MASHQVGDGTGNEVMVTGAIFAMIHEYPGVVDALIPPEGDWNVIELGLDFMSSRYRLTITMVPDQEGEEAP